MLRKKSFIFAASILATVMLLYQCKEKTSSPDEPYIPSIDNVWINAANQNHTFALISDSSNVRSGTFTGTEFHPQFGSSDLQGKFTDRKIEFTIQRPSGAISFSGKFATDDRIESKDSSGNSLVLIRDNS